MYFYRCINNKIVDCEYIKDIDHKEEIISSGKPGIFSNTYYSELIDNYGQSIYKIENNNIIDNEIDINIIKNKIISILKEYFSNAINSIPYHELKAYRLFNSWVADGSIGSQPEYWRNWRQQMEILDSQYQLKKSLINSLSTKEEIESINLSF